MQTECTKQEFYRDILIDSIEGGINYWIDAIKKYNIDAIEAIITEEDSQKDYTINQTIISKGIKRLLNGQVHVCDEILSNVYLANLHNDAGIIDSTDCDCIIQAGLFNNIVYG